MTAADVTIPDGWPITGLAVHPAAAVWPMLPEPDLRRLADDIKINGLRHPIVLDKDGRVLDGRNRLAACEIAGVEPEFVTYDGDPVAYVLSANNERRHMSLPERAAATALTLATEGHRQNGKWARGSVPDAPESTRSRTWADAMMRAGVVLDQLQADVLRAIATGERALDDAYTEARRAKQRTDRLRELGTDLAALVESGVIDLDEAERRADEAARVAGLPDDLAERVRDGHLDIGEAEAVVAERKQRVTAWADRIRDALRTLARMTGSPIPDDLTSALTPDEAAVLTAATTALEGTDHDFLR